MQDIKIHLRSMKETIENVGFEGMDKKERLLAYKDKCLEIEKEEFLRNNFKILKNSRRIKNA